MWTWWGSCWEQEKRKKRGMRKTKNKTTRARERCDMQGKAWTRETAPERELRREFGNAQITAVRSGNEDGESREVELSFSSEEPYERWFGTEILDHSEGCVNLKRLQEIGCVLFNHDRDYVLGKVIEAWVENRRGKAKIRFDEDAEAEKIFRKVMSGTLKGVSVGYTIGNWEKVEKGKKSIDGRFEGECYIATRWMPTEISIVSVPADESVGVGRSAENTMTKGGDKVAKKTGETEDQMRSNVAGGETPDNTTRGGTGEESVQAPASAEERSASEERDEAVRTAVQRERQRVEEINGMEREFGIDLSGMIRDGSSLEKVREYVLNELSKKAAPAAQGARTGESGQDRYVKDMTDAMLLKSGVPVDEASDAARRRAGMSLRAIGEECLEKFEGASGTREMSGDALFQTLTRQFFNPTSAFPAILDATIRKTIVQQYEAVDTTFQKWTTKGTLQDFKESRDHEYAMGGLSAFERVPENGELKEDAPKTTLLPTRKLDTYAKSFSMTREAFINDDIGFLTRVPALYAQRYKTTIDEMVYSKIFENGVTFDGVQLFHTNHNNIASGAGEKPTQAVIQKMITMMQLQKDSFGKAVYVRPKYIVVPVGWGFDLQVIFHSAQVVGSDFNDVNPLHGYPIEIVETPVLNILAGSNKAPWFMVADPSSAKSIQVDYLNGQEKPIVERDTVATKLGFYWKIYGDFGVNVRDFRGIARNNGEVIQ
nr:MAG TPA: major capsid protein [Caudoviricetes sp.]